MAQSTHLVVIDPQRDFCDPAGALFVPGADADMSRLAAMIYRLRDELTDIHISLDSHYQVHISHPIWWRSREGKHPEPFTTITAADVRDGVWTTTEPRAFERSLRYLDALAAGGRYPHVIWPYHCLIGDAGHNVAPELSQAIHAWEEYRIAVPDFVIKSGNPWTEHFSAVQAEVPDPEDPRTQLNTRFIRALEQARVVVWAGEALSHCVANTVRDATRLLGGPEHIAKMTLLTDASSSVGGFETYGDAFLREITAQGMKLSTTKELFA